MATAREIAEKMRKKKEEEGKTSKSAREVAEKIKRYNSLSTDNVDQKYIDTFVNDANTFLTTAEKDFGGLGWANASSSYDSRNSSWEDLRTRADTIGAWLYKNREGINGEAYKSLNSYLDDFHSGGSSVLNSFKSAADYYSQWATEDEYNRWYAPIKRAEELESVLGAKDFEEYSQIGAGVANPDWDSAHAPFEIFGWQPFGDGEDIVNMVSFAEANRDKGLKGSAQAMQGGGSASQYTELINLINEHMKDDEKRIYNYYVGKGDTEKANEYLTYITDVLRQRQGGKIAEQGNNNLSELAVSFFSGAQGGFQGIENFVRGISGADGTDVSALQYANTEMRKDNTGVWMAANDLANSVGNMTPALMAGGFTTAIAGPGAGKVVGAAVTGISSSGNSYAEMIREGYGVDQARKYGLMVGTAEGGLSYLFSGISALGGKVTGNVISKVVDGVDNGIARFFVDFAINSSSEALEEGAQAVLEPIFKMVSTGEDFEGIDWSEVAYSSLLGALSAGLLEGVPNAAKTGYGSIVANSQYSGNQDKTINVFGKTFENNQTKEGKLAYKKELQQELVNEALAIDPENAHAQRMKAKLDSGKTLSGYQIKQLIDTNEQNLWNQDIDKIKSGAETRFSELGEEGDIGKLSDIIAKKNSGENLSIVEKLALKNSTYGERVANESDPDKIEEGQHSSAWAEKLDTERINVKAYSKGIDPDAQDTTPYKKTTVAVAEPPEEEEKVPLTENPTAKEIATEGKFDVSESGSNVEADNNSADTLAEASKKYGAQAQAMIHTYTEGQDVAKYDRGYSAAYDMGRSGVALSYVMNSDSTAYLTEQQRELAYEAGAAAADTAAKEQDAKNKKAVNGKTGRKIGTVKGEGVTISDLKKTFNDTQNKAYKILTTFAEATGVDIVLYKSEANADGDFEGAQGKFDWSDDKLRIDINAGLKNIKSVDDLAKYAMVRTFSHEFTHFIEKWNPIWYNEFRKAVFAELTVRGENVHDLIETKMSQNKGMTYEKASREVVAEAMTDILPDSHFVETLATNHKNIFEKLLAKLKEFLSDLKAYFNTIGHNRSREANALKKQVGDAVHYVESIVELFDKVAVEAVENYQKTVAIDEVVENPAKTQSTESIKAEKNATKGKNAEKTLFEKYDEAKQKYPNSIVLYRVGDFFEVLGDDAKAVAEWADLTMTSRNDPNTGRVPMVGFPFHKLEAYVKKIRRHQDVTVVQEEDGVIKEYPKAPLESSKPKATVSEGALEYADDYDRLKNAISNVTRYEIGGFLFRIYKNGDTWQGHLDQVIQSEGGYPVSDASGLHYKSEIFNDRAKAVEDLIAVARNNKLLGEATTEPQITNNTDGGITNGTEREEQTAEADRGRPNKADAGGNERTLSQTEDGRGVSQESGGERQDIGQDVHLRGGQRELNQTEKRFSEDSFITPREGSVEAEEYAKLAEYGIEGYVVKKSAWDRDVQAFANNGIIYMREDLDEKFRGAVVPHEATHIMKHLKYQPYLDFIDRTPYMLNMSSEAAQAILKAPAKHYNIDLLDANKKQLTRIYDEINATVFGSYARGDIVGDLLTKVNEAFNNFDEYIKELSAIHEKFKAERKKEVTPNVEHVDNGSTVRQSDTDRQGDPQVLEGLQAEDVQGDVRGGDSVGDSVERGQEARRDDVRDGSGAGTRSRSGVGDSQSGDIRRNDELTPEAAEKLHEEVTEQIAQQSTELPKGKNFVIGDSLDLPNGEKARYKANIEAIRLVKQLEAEGRYATEAEQAILSKYVGWGGLANAFDERKADWSREFKELSELLTKEEYELARGSTLNAHYTDISVIKAMYDGLRRLGFDGGRMMEPSSGVGNFVGAMPADMSAKVKSWTMVELDSITGLIAKYLYPNADVRIQGFEKANIPNNYMDVIISNVPFGNYPITDKAYPKKVTSAIHNYFFAKSLDKVRPGGIVMFITSSYTMNSRDETVRRYIMQRADLLGAIRLPDTAFKGNAGTEVVTDILILKKRAANTAYSGEDFLTAPYKYISGYSGAYINGYFDAHPEMVLGTATMDGSMYRGNNLTYKALEGKGSLADQIREAFKSIKGKMEYPVQLSPEKTNFAVERADKKTKADGYVAKNGKIYQNKDGELVEQNVNAKVAERIKGMLDIRDAAKALMNAQQQGLKEAEIKKARTNLNKLYDAFVKKNGFLNAPSNKSAFAEDPDRYSLFALENWNPDKKTATKSDIFSKNTIAPNRTVTSAKDISEGLIVSVNQTGGVDVSLIAKLTGKTEADVSRELIDSRQVFKNRNGVLETAETYLSGNVRAKLRDAEALVPMDSDYQKNVEALKAVIPEDVGYQDIFVNPGTPWIPSSVYSDFAAYMLGTSNSEWRQNVDVTRNPETGNFTVELKNSYLKHNAQNTQKWGTPRRSFLDLFDAMLNSRSVVVKDKLEDGTSVINKDATAAANEKIDNITKEFQEWLWRDETRRTDLATLYNETFNSIVTPKYNGDNLTVNGANAMKPLRPHQRNAVQRVISSGGNTLLAHKVGAGKTYEMAAAAMKLKELGLVKKPLFAVPKPLVAQWGTEFIDFFPTAKLLVAEASDFTAANRKIFMNRIANGDYDAVIVSYEQFEKLPVSDDFTRELYQEQINSVIAALEEAKAEKGAKAMSVKDLEKRRKSLQAKIDKLTDKAKDEDNIDFEQLGVDSLFVDEAHSFKNLFYTSSMTNVSGLGRQEGSKRAFDLYTKVRYLQKLNGGKGIVFATATPVMNSMSEMYIMQKYLQPDLLEQLGLSTFDAWAKQFGEVVNGVEIKPSGQGYRVKQSFSRFKNMSELQLLFRNFADVLTDIPGLKIPTMKGGKVNVVVCEPGQFQKDYMKELEKRADNIKNVDPTVDNMLKITSDGRKISYTQRMIDPSLPYEEGCKIYRCADNVVKAYNESKDIKGTQLIFCDMATPKGKSKTETTETDDDTSMDMESARLYDDLKARLIQNGIPAKEIAFIHEADTDQKKKKLFADVNDGKVRVLIGSTGKMGVGMNAQKRIVAIHHLDAPWRPGDVEQRNGRAFRQGNINDEVENFTYVTEGSFDARLWDILERKQNFINQVMNGESVGRETEDTGEVTLSAAEVKALASGSPLIMEQVQLDTDIKKLESLYRAHRSSVRSARERLERDKGDIEVLERRIEKGKADVSSIKDTYSEGRFHITVGKQTYTEKKDAGAALMVEATAKAVDTGYTTIGSFAGFNVRVVKTHEGIKGLISGKQGYSFNTYPNNTTFMINHMISVVEGISEKVSAWETQLSDTQKDIVEQEKLIAEPFAKQAELDEKRKRYDEVMAILNPKEEQSLDSVAEDTVQEQSREYLGEGEQEQQRTDTLTDREVLEMAANEIKVSDLNQAETDALTIFQDRLSKLKDLQDKRAEAGRLYKEQQFGTKVDRQAASETLNRMQILDGQIKKATAEVLSVEEKEVLNRVLKKARKVVEVQERQHGQEILNRWRDRRKNADNIKKYRERLRGDVDELTNWIIGPNNKDIVKHVPDVLKNSVIPFLSSINFMSKRSLKGGNATKADEAFMDRLKKLNSALKINIDASGLYSGYNDLPPNFMERLQTFIDSTEALVKNNSGELVINQMTSEELKDLSSIVRTLKKYIMQVNRFHNNAMYSHVYEAGDNSIEFMKELDNAGENTGAVSNFLFWQQIRPAYAFERFGKGGEAIYDGLRQGQAKLAFNTKEIESFTKKAYTDKEVKAWEDEIKTFSLGRDIVKMPVSYIMSFYELSKDPEALEHINGEGIRVATYTHKGKKISDVGHILTVGEFNQIIGSLTDRQREVADNLQKYMAEQGGKWGNYVSVARFGEELFTNPKYFPINSDGRHLSATVEEHPSAAALYALLNMSFTKSRKEGANNRIVIYSIFDVFANHMASMAQYNAMALPVLDALKWFNYQQVFIDDEGNKTVIANVREQMDRVYGVPEETRPGSGKQGYAETFIVNIIKAFNGTAAQGAPYDSGGIKAMHRYNIAQVAYNLRVVVQQPLAITRAGMIIDYKSIIKGLKLKPSEIKKNVEEMEKHSGIAAWKSLGFYDVNISRGLTHLIKHDSTFMDKVGDVGMWGAEKADLWTWAAIWSACKEEVRNKQHLTPESAGFYEAVTQLFEDVIYKTQVVDSILTKNEFMRDKGLLARLTGSFMSEPTTNASMLIDAYDKYRLDIQRGMTKRDAWQKNGQMIGRRLYVYAIGAVMLAVVQSVADAWRDDDDYEEWYEKWLEAFGGNLVDELMPFNKLPILADFYDLAKELLSVFGVDTYGNPPQSVYMQWYDSLVKGAQIIEKIRGKETKYTYYGHIYKLLQAVSGMTGLPMASATREIITAWNNTVGAMAPSLKVTTYEPSELAQIRYAYEDGYLTREEVVEILIEKGLVDTENEAYFTIQEWEAGEGYSRYDAVFDAVLNGGDISAAMDELTSHGYAEEDVLRQVKSQIGKWYYDEGSQVRITKQQAINMLDKYTDMTDEEITATVNKWSSAVVTGIKYEDIDDEFMEGNITASRAIEMYVRYGSMTKEKATEKVTVLEFVKEHPESEGISYAAVNGYKTYCEPLGVPANTYYEAWKYKNTLSGEVKESMMTYINSLSLSARQKDSLYFAFGWAESKLWEAPWH